MKKELNYYDQQTVHKWEKLNCEKCFRSNCFAKKMIEKLTYTNYLTERLFDFVGWDFMGSTYNIERKVCDKILTKPVIRRKKKKIAQVEITHPTLF